MHESRDRYDRHEHRPLEHCLVVRRDVEQGHAVHEDGERHRAAHGLTDRADAAVEADAAQNARADHEQGVAEPALGSAPPTHDAVIAPLRPAAMPVPRKIAIR